MASLAEDSLRSRSGGHKRQFSKDSCALLIRHFDGTAIRNRFGNEQTLADVRVFIRSRTHGDRHLEVPQKLGDDVTSDDDGHTKINRSFGSDDYAGPAFDFLQTFPKRLFTLEDESKTLVQLGLSPSATLILKAARKRTWSDVLTTVMGYIYFFLGIGWRPPSSPPSGVAPVPSDRIDNDIHHDNDANHVTIDNDTPIL